MLGLVCVEVERGLIIPAVVTISSSLRKRTLFYIDVARK
jgi:hypothetical protein